MEIKWDTASLDLQNLVSISRGDKGQVLKYLNQFQELVPERIKYLKTGMQEGDRRKIRQILHQMSPQLQFFGIPNVLTPIRRLELEYETMSLEELEDLIDDILASLDRAMKEIEHVLKDYFQ